jgi:osmoprotectant transport system permease protein
MLEFLNEYRTDLLRQTAEHLGLTFLSVLIACAIAIPLGILATRRKTLAGPLLGVAGVLQTIPSIALLGFLIPVLGIGFKPALFALFLYAILPIMRNVYAGIQSVDPRVREAAFGMGMTDGQVLRRVELPLALPVLFAGIRTATVINVGVATLAAYIGAGGLGEFIFGGIALNNSQMILAGAVPAAVLAVLLDRLLALAQRWSTPGPGQRPKFNLGFLLLLPLLAGFYWLPQTASGGLRTGFEPEFMGRRDGYLHLREVYPEVRFQPTVLNGALMYQALASGAIDAGCGYSTDGRIRAYGLRVLRDDRHAFPPYECAFLTRSEFSQSHPEVLELLTRLSGQLSDSLMTELNFRVDQLNESPAAVARSFLESIGLYRPSQGNPTATLVMGSKIFSEQYILTEMCAQLIEGYLPITVERRTGLGGTKICYDALRNGEIDLYPEYSGTALLVLLQPSEATVDRLIEDPAAAFAFVRERSRDSLGLLWLPPLGFNNTYAILVREEKAAQKGWEYIGDLK